MEATVLVVDDEKDINFILSSNLKKEGFKVLSAGSAEAGLELAQKHHPDLFVLDIMLPKIDGLEMMRIVRQDSQAPILFLTAKKDEIDRILGLKLGADDYIVKPFSVREVIARVKAILRRTMNSPRKSAKKMIKVGGIEMDFERHEVKVNGKRLTLSPREFQLLKLLAEAEGKVLSREKLSQEIWGNDESVEIDIRTIDQHVARLRKKLLNERDRIATISNFGYQIRADESATNGHARRAR